MNTHELLEMIHSCAADDHDPSQVPECLWLTRAELAAVAASDLPAGATISLRLSTALGELPGAIADARLYGDAHTLRMLVEHYRIDFTKVRPLSYPSYVDLASVRLADLDREHVGISYLSTDDTQPLALEYEVRTAGMTLLDHAVDGYRRIARVEQAISADIDACSRSFQELLTPRPLVTVDEFDAVDNAGTASAKGSALEQLVDRLFVSAGGFRRIGRNLRKEYEELDLLFEIRRRDGAWPNRGPLMVIECKNWTGPVGLNALDSLERRIRDQAGQCQIGVLVAWHGITDGVRAELKKITREPYLIVVMDRDGLRTAAMNASFPTYLETCIEEAQRR